MDYKVNDKFLDSYGDINLICHITSDHVAMVSLDEQFQYIPRTARFIEKEKFQELLIKNIYVKMSC